MCLKNESLAVAAPRRARAVKLLSGAALCLGVSIAAWGRGVSPYLPLNMSPEIERKIERVLILADKPVMRRPIPAALVLDALPKACAIDPVLCGDVESYLSRYTRGAGVTKLQVEAAASSGNSDKVIPNAHGLEVGSPWEIVGSAFYQPGDYLLLNAGGIAYQGRATPTGTVLSAGFDFAQLDIGYRDHWLSPMTDSSALISTEAPTMPSITLSNYAPISRLGINYEIFLAEMSKQDGIAYFGSTTSGHPKLAGLQLGIEPVNGYALSINRVFQYGGGARNAGTSQFFDALFKNSNRPDVAGQDGEFGNQVASITSSILFPGKTPFAVHVEYAGEDNSYAGSYRLGATNLSISLDLPKLWDRYDLSYEISEWQNAWYVHHLYPEGLTNHGYVIGHWFGDARQFGDQVFGRSQSLSVGMQFASGSYLQARYRTLANASYSTVGYKHLQEFGLNYTTTWRGHTLGGELYAGRDVFGDSYARLAASVDIATNRGGASGAAGANADADDVTDVFVDTGVNYSRAYNRIALNMPYVWTDYQAGYHLALGARRKVSERNDLGVRLEFDDINRHSLISIRALDYRYRLNHSLALGAFFGVSRYQISLPAYGYYWGAGVQWTNVFPAWDLGLDLRHNDKLTRTKVLATDPSPGDAGGIYIDTSGAAMYLSYRF